MTIDKQKTAEALLSIKDYFNSECERAVYSETTANRLTQYKQTFLDIEGILGSLAGDCNRSTPEDHSCKDCDFEEKSKTCVACNTCVHNPDLPRIVCCWMGKD